MSISGTKKNINLFLMDGDPAGRFKCSLLNWTGVGYKIPRSYFPQCKDMPHMKQSGVYMLFGSDRNGDDVIYIGQAVVRKNGEGLSNRINEPHDSIDFWTDAVMFTTTNDALGPTEVCYLENKFCKMAKDAKRYIVKNGNEPSIGNLTEEKEAEMDEFIDYAVLITGVMGYKVFEPLVSPEELASDTKTFHFKSNKFDAKAIITSEGIVLLKGSQISPTTVNSCPQFTINMREKHSAHIADWTTTEDILFPSPSSAASFVSGSSVSGNDMWVLKDGTPLKDVNKAFCLNN